jgi:fructose-1-phosphate kinase PfkB-like protein
MTVLTITPNPSLDRTYEIGGLNRGAVHRAGHDQVDPGGKGVNVSRAVAAAGHRTVAVLPLGGPEGALLAALLNDLGIEVAGVPVSGSTRVNISLAEPDGALTKINAAGPQVSSEEAEALLEAVTLRAAGEKPLAPRALSPAIGEGADTGGAAEGGDADVVVTQGGVTGAGVTAGDVTGAGVTRAGVTGAGVTGAGARAEEARAEGVRVERAVGPVGRPGGGRGWGPDDPRRGNLAGAPDGLPLGASADRGWIACCGSLPRGLSPEWYAELVSRLHTSGVRIALDASGPALAAALRERPDVVKPNAEELSEAVGRPLATVGDVVQAAQELRGLGVGAVLASLGATGQILVDGTGTYFGCAPVATVRSDVGAGDASLAGFLVAGGSGADALTSALAHGAAAVQLPGSAMPTPTDLEPGAVSVTTDIPLDRPLGPPLSHCADGAVR